MSMYDILQKLLKFTKSSAFLMGETTRCGTCFKDIIVCDTINNNVPCHGKVARKIIAEIEEIIKDC